MKITRYIFDTNAFAVNTERVKYNALMPDHNGKTSVFNITNLHSDKIWDIGVNHVAILRGRDIKARGDILAIDVSSEELMITPDTQDHPLHANISGRPTEKSEQKLIAMKLADKAELHVVPVNPE